MPQALEDLLPCGECGGRVLSRFARTRIGAETLASGGAGRRLRRYAGTAMGSRATASKRTETSFETPGSSIVTPYITWAISMVRLL
jgi:hypothetical protein